MKVIDCSRENPITATEMVNACDKLGYKKMGYQYDERKAERWLSKNPLMATCPDLKFAVNCFISTIA